MQMQISLVLFCAMRGMRTRGGSQCMQIEIVAKKISSPFQKIKCHLKEKQLVLLRAF